MDFRIGDVVNRTFGAVSRNFLTFVLLSLLLVGTPTFVLGFAQFALLSDNVAMFAILALIAGLVSFMTSYILQGAVIHGAVVDFNGGQASFSRCLSTGLRHFLPILAIVILMTLGVIVGMVLLIIPGIILAIMWIVAVPVRVVENTGVIESLNRSRELTYGNRWKIFGLFVIFLILVTLISMLVALPLGLFGAFGAGAVGANLVTVIIDVVANTLGGIIGAAGVSAIYYELRKSNEGVGAEALAEIFA